MPPLSQLGYRGGSCSVENGRSELSKSLRLSFTVRLLWLGYTFVEQVLPTAGR